MKLLPRHPSCSPIVLCLACGLCLSLMAGCEGGGSGSHSGTSSPAASSSGSMESAVKAAAEAGSLDGEFLDHMTRLAELSTHFAELELSNGQRPAVQELAEKIKRRESVDIAFLQAERTRLGIATRSVGIENDPQANDLRRRMQAATPAEADTLFVEGMIKHRLETSKYAESCLPYLRSPNLSYYCRAVTEDAGASLRELRSVQTAEQTVPVNARAGKRYQNNAPRR